MRLRIFDITDLIIQVPLQALSRTLASAQERVEALAVRAHDVNVRLAKRNNRR